MGSARPGQHRVGPLLGDVRSTCSYPPVHFHIGASLTTMDVLRQLPVGVTRRRHQLAIGGTLLFIGNARVVVNIICSGMLERHPDLKIVSVESGAGGCRSSWRRSTTRWPRTHPTSWRRPVDDAVGVLPSARSTPRSGSSGRNLPSLVDAVGEDNILFETDFPHPTCLYPDPLDAGRGEHARVEPEARNKILGGNAAQALPALSRHDRRGFHVTRSSHRLHRPDPDRHRVPRVARRRRRVRAGHPGGGASRRAPLRARPRADRRRRPGRVALRRRRDRPLRRHRGRASSHAPGIAHNRHCASGLGRVTTAAGSIIAGMDRVVVAGGAHSPSTSPRSRAGCPGTDDVRGRGCRPPTPRPPTRPTVDMSITVGWNAAVEAGSPARSMDAWALRSHERAVAAIDAGSFADEIFPVEVTRRDGTSFTFDVDEHPRRGSTAGEAGLAQAAAPRDRGLQHHRRQRRRRERRAPPRWWSPTGRSPRPTAPRAAGHRPVLGRRSA